MERSSGERRCLRRDAFSPFSIEEAAQADKYKADSAGGMRSSDHDHRTELFGSGTARTPEGFGPLAAARLMELALENQAWTFSVGYSPVQHMFRRVGSCVSREF